MASFPSDEEFERLLKSGKLPDIPASTDAEKEEVAVASESNSKVQDQASGASETNNLEIVAKEIQQSLESIVKTFEDLSSMLKRVMEDS